VGRWVVGLLFMAALVTLGFLALAVIRGEPTPRLFAVEDYRGRQVAEVQRILPPESGWRIEEDTGRRDDTRPGDVLAQDPAPGGQLTEGGVLRLTVSQGDELRTVPDLTDLTLEEAGRQLAGLGLVLAQPNQEQYSETAPAGQVLDVVEKGQQLPKAGHVTLVVSKGAQPRPVPSLSGTAEASTAALQALGLVVGTAEDYSETVPEGQVIGTDPPPGTEVPKGGTVNLVISLGRRPITVPEVVGQSAADASDTLEAAGLVVRTDGAANKPVIASDPAAGSVLYRGDQVIIITQRT
jgi:serine/threonine-protein kinase